MLGDLRREGLFQQHLGGARRRLPVTAREAGGDPVGEDFDDASFQRADAQPRVLAVAVANTMTAAMISPNSPLTGATTSESSGAASVGPGTK